MRRLPLASIKYLAGDNRIRLICGLFVSIRAVRLRFTHIIDKYKQNTVHQSFSEDNAKRAHCALCSDGFPSPLKIEPKLAPEDSPWKAAASPLNSLKEQSAFQEGGEIRISETIVYDFGSLRGEILLRERKETHADGLL